MRLFLRIKVMVLGICFPLQRIDTRAPESQRLIYPLAHSPQMPVWCLVGVYASVCDTRGNNMFIPQNSQQENEYSVRYGRHVTCHVNKSVKERVETHVKRCVDVLQLRVVVDVDLRQISRISRSRHAVWFVMCNLSSTQ